MTGADIRVTRSPNVKDHKDDFEGAVTRNLQSALKDAMDLSNADYDTLEDIADGLEKMLHTWNDVQERRAMEYTRLKESLARDTTQCHKRTADMKETLEDIGVRVSQESAGKDDTFVCPLTPCSPRGSRRESPVAVDESAAVKEISSSDDETKWMPEWAALLNKDDLSDRASTKRKGGLKHLVGVKAMPLKKKPRKQIISVQIQDDKRDKGGDCACDQGDGSPNGDRKKWPPAKQSPLSFIKGKDSTGQLKKQVEELQIALLESATEYELKILQMKMQMLQNKNELSKQQPQQHQRCSPEEAEGGTHTVDCSRKQVSRLQKEKKDLTKEVFELRKRERMFDHQRKVLEDAQYRVNCLKRELMRKEGQLVNGQLREKALSVRLCQLEEVLQSSNNKSDFVRLWQVLPELQDWLQSLRKDGPIRLDHSHIVQFQHYEALIGRVLDALPYKPDEQEPSVHRTCQAPHNFPAVPVDKYRKKLTERYARPAKPKEAKKEAEALQKELHKLAHTPKPSKASDSRGISSTTTETYETSTGSQQRRQQQQQQPYWIYGAALLLGGLLFRNRTI